MKSRNSAATGATGKALKSNGYQSELQAARQVALAAGRLLKEGFHSPFSVKFKGAVDLVTEVDLASEKLVKESLAKLFPRDSFYGEEGGGTDYHAGRVWVVDPLDGTTNFAHRLPIFCVSIGFFENGKVRAGAVYQPITDELYSASEGGGAWLNGRRIRVSKTGRLINALGVTGFPYKIEEYLDGLLSQLRSLMPKTQGIRRLGSAAMDLCFTAGGRFDFFWESDLHVWDVAAGALILREAGGTITDFDGGDDFIDRLQLLASNGKLHGGLRKLISQCQK